MENLIKKENVVALVPLRGGSKGIPGKNIKEMNGRPLCAWVLEAAWQARIFDKIVVSTDSSEIVHVVQALNLPVEIIIRPYELATDEATTDVVMLHAAEKMDFEILFTIQATTPLLTARDLVEAYCKFKVEELDSLLTGVKVKRFFWSLNAEPLNYNPFYRPMRQNFEGVIMENGAFYITKREILERYKNRLGGKMGIYEMSEDASIELDDIKDWDIVENILRNRKNILI